MIAAIVGALILWAVLAPSAAMVIGRAVKLRDTRERPAGGCGEDPARRARGAHLRLVR